MAGAESSVEGVESLVPSVGGNLEDGTELEFPALGGSAVKCSIQSLRKKPVQIMRVVLVSAEVIEVGIVLGAKGDTRGDQQKEYGKGKSQ